MGAKAEVRLSLSALSWPEATFVGSVNARKFCTQIRGHLL